MKIKVCESTKQGKRRYKDKMKKQGKYNKGNRTSQTRRYLVKHRKKVKARYALCMALKKGLIKKSSKCCICKTVIDQKYYGIVGHHSNYSKPLEVIWVCCHCHNEIHMSKHWGVNKS